MALPITAGLKVRLEDRLRHHLRRHLHHSIPYRRNPQRPLLSICLPGVGVSIYGLTYPKRSTSREFMPAWIGTQR